MRIGELSKKSGLSRDTIRYYERHGLIRSAPSRSTTNSYRHYGADAVLTLGMIREAQAAGMTLADVRAFLDALSVVANGEDAVVAFLDGKIVEVETNIRRSQRFLETLQATRTALIAGPDPSEFDWARKDGEGEI